MGQTPAAIELYEQALAIAREIGDRGGEGADLGNLGNCYDDVRADQRAIDLYEQALAIAREIGDRSGEGAALGNLGNSYVTLGEVRRAIDLYEQALAIAREIGDRGGEGAALGNLGNCYAALGADPAAIELYEQALAIAREIGDRGGEGNALGNLGSRLRPWGRSGARSSSTSRRWPSPGRSATAAAKAAHLGNLGSCYATGGGPARDRALRAGAGHRPGDRRPQAARLHPEHLAEAYTDLGDWSQAIRYGEDGVQIADEVGFAQGSSEGRVQLAVAYLHAGEYDLARATAQAARDTTTRRRATMSRWCSVSPSRARGASMRPERRFATR